MHKSKCEMIQVPSGVANLIKFVAPRIIDGVKWMTFMFIYRIMDVWVSEKADLHARRLLIIYKATK
jgi:hypothetical protein